MNKTLAIWRQLYPAEQKMDVGYLARTRTAGTRMSQMSDSFDGYRVMRQ
jgi:hypothetical protein